MLRYEVYQLRFDVSELVAGFVSRDVAQGFVAGWPIECTMIDIGEYTTRGEIEMAVERASRRAAIRSRRL